MDKFFNVYSSICSKIYRSRIKELWDFGKEGIIPGGEDARLLEVLKEHREYYKVWGIADTIDDPGYTIKGVNPFLHVAAHLLIENQLAEENPKEVREILWGKWGQISTFNIFFSSTAYSQILKCEMSKAVLKQMGANLF